jgi:hypothetical protein
MLKLSKTSWFLLVIGIFIIVFAGLGVVCYQQINQQNQLNEELTLAEAKLNEFQLEQLSYRKGELERRLSQAISQFETAKAILSQSTGSIATTSTLFDIAEAYGVEVTELSSSGLVSEELEGVPCSVLSLTVRVEGDIPDLIGFITKLNDDFTTGVVQSVEISIPETTGGEESSANIQLVIYTHQGD